MLSKNLINANFYTINFDQNTMLQKNNFADERK